MIFRPILAIVLSILAIYAFSQRNKTPAVALLIFSSTIIGIGFTFFPETATFLAHQVGVGRGADLIFYLFIVIVLAAIFNLHLRIRANHEVISELARSIALNTVRRPDSGRRADEEG